jgi:hypothetical protein
MDRTFCGKQIEVTIPNSQLDLEKCLFFGEFSEIPSFKREDYLQKSLPATVFVGNFRYYEPDGSGIRFGIRSRKWKAPETHRKLNFTCYLVVDGQVCEVLSSPGFTIQDYVRKRTRTKSLQKKQQRTEGRELINKQIRVANTSPKQLIEPPHCDPLQNRPFPLILPPNIVFPMYNNTQISYMSKDGRQF